jgi:4-diphosphocytidyl-2-C-methyl-D-erythritol kinase
VTSAVSSVEPFILAAPAKINWYLSIGGRREDGYHEISSLVQCVDLCDYLTFENAEDLQLVTDTAIPVAENIVYKTALMMKEYLQVKGGARIILRKQIPIAAGLGGGSSDAASALRGLARLWGVRISDGKLLAMAASLGSDVPFFLRQPAAVAKGRGEKLRKVRISASYFLVLVKPPVDVSTAWAYARFDREPGLKLTKNMVDIKLFCQALNNRDFYSLRRLFRNDFEEVIMKEFPVVRELKERLLLEGAEVAAMSGSGPAVFGVFADRDSAEEACGHMNSDFCCLARTIIAQV